MGVSGIYTPAGLYTMKMYFITVFSVDISLVAAFKNDDRL